MRASFTWMLVAASAVMVLSSPAMAEDGNVLNVYNWSDYIAPDTLEKFTAETGIKVNYDVYDGNETLAAKLQAGKSGYDVVFPSASPFLAQQIKAGIYQKLDRSKLKNYANVDPATLKTLAAVADPGNLYSVPYMIAATGIGYNVDMVKKAAPGIALDSWSLLFDPTAVAKLKGCGVTFLNTPTEVFPAALTYLGKSGASQSPDDLKLAADTVSKVRPYIKYFHSSKYINDLANGDICVAHGYVGDLVQARTRGAEAAKPQNIAIVIPKEGAIVNIDVMAVPVDAPHPDNALKFIDFMMRPDIIGAITNTTGYANAIPASKSTVKKELLDDPAIYPPASVLAKEFQVPPAAQDYERLRTRTWTKVTTGK
ncbi:MAG TPA: polyamine ABC transporter substrate-binding protein [Patescibacteria group bacterium]|nr:polyamine ABC transporter substrate-binding protein [Patescibacteria group bacterium]